MKTKLNRILSALLLSVMIFSAVSVCMPIVAIGNCILIGWVAGPDTVIREVTLGGAKFSRKGLYLVMLRFVTPVLLAFLLLQSLGLF